MITFSSSHEINLPKAVQKRVWDAFMRNGSAHSAAASTLCFILNKCHQENQPYRLSAVPGKGYWIEPMTEDGEPLNAQ